MTEVDYSRLTEERGIRAAQAVAELLQSWKEGKDDARNGD